MIAHAAASDRGGLGRSRKDLRQSSDSSSTACRYAEARFAAVAVAAAKCSTHWAYLHSLDLRGCDGFRTKQPPRQGGQGRASDGVEFVHGGFRFGNHSSKLRVKAESEVR